MSTSLQVPVVHPKEIPAQSKANFSLLRGVLEGFADGLLILTQDGTCLHSNQKAKAFCQSLSSGSAPAVPGVPGCLQSLCNALQEGRDLFPDHALVITQDFTGPAGNCIRARVQWLDWPDSAESYFLVLLEDQTQTARTAALMEALQYDLTPRERDVWILRRANRSYEEIALELFITVNTVKRHLKSIYAKRKLVLDDLAN